MTDEDVTATEREVCGPLRVADPLLTLDLLYDEGFPQDPYMSGRLRVEMERMGYGGEATDG